MPAVHVDALSRLKLDLPVRVGYYRMAAVRGIISSEITTFLHKFRRLKSLNSTLSSPVHISYLKEYTVKCSPGT